MTKWTLLDWFHFFLTDFEGEMEISIDTNGPPLHALNRDNGAIAETYRWKYTGGCLGLRIARSINWKLNEKPLEVHWPTQFQRALVRYFKYPLPPGSHDCGGFIRYLHGLPVEPKSYKWELLSPPITNYGTIRSGQIVALVDSKIQGTTHLAICVTTNVFLSKFGRKGGPLMFSSLETCLKLFGGDRVHLAKPATLASSGFE